MPGQGRRGGERCPADGQRGNGGIGSDGQQFSISPVRLLGPPRQRPPVEYLAQGRVVILDVENATDPAAGTGEAGARGMLDSAEHAPEGLNVGHETIERSA